MVRRRTVQRLGMAKPNMARTAGMAGNARIGGNPRMRRQTQGPLAMPGRAARQIGAMPVGMKPRNVFWSRIPVIRTLINWIEGLFFSKSHLRVMQRKRVGTGLGVIRERALTSRRSRLPATSEQAKILRNRTLGLRGSIVNQHARGKIHGVLKYPGKKAA